MAKGEWTDTPVDSSLGWAPNPSAAEGVDRVVDLNYGIWLTDDPSGLNGGINPVEYNNDDPIDNSDSSGLNVVPQYVLAGEQAVSDHQWYAAHPNQDGPPLPLSMVDAQRRSATAAQQAAADAQAAALAAMPQMTSTTAQQNYDGQLRAMVSRYESLTPQERGEYTLLAQKDATAARDAYHDQKGWGPLMSFADSTFNPQWNGVGNLNAATVMVSGELGLRLGRRRQLLRFREVSRRHRCAASPLSLRLRERQARHWQVPVQAGPWYSWLRHQVPIRRRLHKSAPMSPEQTTLSMQESYRLQGGSQQAARFAKLPLMRRTPNGRVLPTLELHTPGMLGTSRIQLGPGRRIHIHG